MSNLNMLIEKYAAQMKDLEMRMAEIKHKLEIVTEATRLLEEEQPSDENPPNRSDGDGSHEEASSIASVENETSEVHEGPCQEGVQQLVESLRGKTWQNPSPMGR